MLYTGYFDEADTHGPSPTIIMAGFLGTAREWQLFIFERYIALAREASTSGDRVASENLYQHAEHYFRVMKAANEGHQQRATRPSAPTDLQTEMSEAGGSEIDGPARASPSQRQPHSS